MAEVPQFLDVRETDAGRREMRDFDGLLKVLKIHLQAEVVARMVRPFSVNRRSRFLPTEAQGFYKQEVEDAEVGDQMTSRRSS